MAPANLYKNVRQHFPHFPLVHTLLHYHYHSFVFSTSPLLLCVPGPEAVAGGAAEPGVGAELQPGGGDAAVRPAQGPVPGAAAAAGGPAGPTAEQNQGAAGQRMSWA